ncbi:hypothetical protein HGRIS_000881 [Hohenbuehelia grisea]
MPDSEIEIIDLTQTDSESSSSGDDEDTSVAGDISSETSNQDDDDEFVLDESTRAQLHVAIASVSELRLRQVMALVVDSMPEAELLVARQLVTMRKRKHARPVPRFEECVNCGEEFDLQEQREEEECKFHPGSMQVDEESFADHDEACHGPMDTEQNRLDFPENFLWTCCDDDGNSEGCVQGFHSSEGLQKRRRVTFED